jgi:murein DD-endopeptidase MepM/ murein hydrolase activator NlpD
MHLGRLRRLRPRPHVLLRRRPHRRRALHAAAPALLRGARRLGHGTGVYVLGQGEFNGKPAVLLRVGNATLYVNADLSATKWHHLAAVRTGTTFTLYLDGASVGATTISGTAPAGRLRFGKDTFDAALDGGGSQFYGLVDDVAVFTRALSAAEVASLASAQHLSGTETGLLAGWTFGYQPGATMPATLSRPVTTTPAATIRPVSANRDAVADAAQYPLALTAHMNLPFPVGTVAEVSQGWEGDVSHRGYAAFCLDLVLPAKATSEGEPFYAVAPGRVDFVKQDQPDGTPTANFVSVEHATHEICDYLHLPQNASSVTAGAHVDNGQQVAKIGHTGTGGPHLHVAVTNTGESRHNVAGTGTFVTIPAPYSNYEVSTDGGATWQHVVRGVPKKGQRIRRATISPVRWTAVWRRSTAGETQVYDWTYEQMRAKYDELWPQGWRLKSLDPYVVGGQVRYTAVWRPGTEGETQVYGWGLADLRKKYDELWPQGWRLKLLQPYVLNGQLLFTAVWKPSNEGEVQVYDWTYEQMRAKYDELWPQGWRLKLLQPYVVNGQVRYAAVWRPGTEGETQVYGWSLADFRKKYDELWPQGWRLKMLQPFVLNGQTLVSAAWRPGNDAEYQVYDWQYGDVRARYDVLWALGWRVERLHPYVV